MRFDPAADLLRDNAQLIGLAGRSLAEASALGRLRAAEAERRAEAVVDRSSQALRELRPQCKVTRN